MSAAFYYDAAVALVALICFFIFYSKGFLSSALRLVTVVAAAYLGFFVSGRFGPVVYEKFIYPKLLESVANRLASYYAGQTQGIGGGLIASAIQKYLASQAQSTDITAQAAAIIHGSVESLIQTVLRIVMFAVVFLITTLLLRGAAKALQEANDIPLVGSMNKVLGGAFGLLVAAALLIIASCIISILAKYFSNDWLSDQAIQSSYLFSFIYNNNPLIAH